jgi:hypothetical protein
MFAHPVAKMKPGRRYFILEDPLPHDDKPLGRVVVDKWRPMREFIPCEPDEDEPPHGLYDIKPRTEPNEHVYKDWEQFVGSTSNWSIDAGLASLLGIKHSRESESGITLKSKEMKTCNLTNTRKCFNELYSNSLYRRDLTDLLNGAKKDRLYFVVGYITTKGGEWKEFKSAKQSSKVEVTVPVLEAVGSPLPNNIGDPQIAPGVGSSKRMELTTKLEDDVIFALAYDVIKVSYGLSRVRIKKADVRLRNAGPKIGKADERVLAADDDDSDDSDDSDNDVYGGNKNQDKLDFKFVEEATVEDLEDANDHSDSITFILQA